MQPQAPTQPLASAGQQQTRTGLPHWEQLTPTVRQALMISLTTIIVKHLAGQDAGKEPPDE